MNDDVVPDIRVIASPADANPSGVIFGGWLLSQIDQAGGLLAWRQAGGRCVLASIEATFETAVEIGDEVSIYTQPETQGRTSLTVSFGLWRRPRDQRERIRAVTGTMRFVAVDAAGKPRKIEP